MGEGREIAKKVCYLNSKKMEDRTKKKDGFAVLMILIILGGVLLSVFVIDSSQQKTTSSSSSVRSGSWYCAKEKGFGFYHKEDWDKYIDIALSRDDEAFVRFKTAHLYAGTGTLIREGTRVYVEDRSISGEWAKVRFEGEIRSWYMFHAYLDYCYP